MLKTRLKAVFEALNEREYGNILASFTRTNTVAAIKQRALSSGENV